MKFRAIITSRWLLLPIALVLGGTIGAAGTMWWAQRRLISELPLRAAMTAETLARLDRGDTTATRRSLLGELTSTLQVSAIGADMWGVDMSKRSRELRNVATYLSTDPKLKLPPESARLMSAFHPFTEEELATGRCRSGICELKRSKPSLVQTPQSR